MQELSIVASTSSLLRKRFIGEAFMDENKTVILQLWSSTDFSPLKATVAYDSGDSGYQEIIEHLGGLRQGEMKLVPGWC